MSYQVSPGYAASESVDSPPQLEHLLAVVNKLLGSLYLFDRRTVWSTVAKEVHEFFDCELTSLFLVDEENPSQLKLQEQMPGPREAPLTIPIQSARGQGLTAHAAARAEALMLNAEQIEDSPFIKDARSPYLPSGKCYSVLYVPLKNRKGKLLGLVRLNNKNHSQNSRGNHFFSTADRNAMEILAAQIVVLLESSKIFETARELIGDVQKSKSTTETVSTILEYSQELIGADLAKLALWNRDRGRLVLAGVLGDPRRPLLGATVAKRLPINKLWLDALNSEPQEPGFDHEILSTPSPPPKRICPLARRRKLTQQKARLRSNERRGVELVGRFPQPSSARSHHGARRGISCRSYLRRDHDAFCSEKSSSAIAIILRVHKQPVGVLHLESRRANWFDEIDRRTLKTLVKNLAVGVQSISQRPKTEQMPDAQDPIANLTLGESEGFYNTLVSHVPLDMWRKNVEGQFVWVSDRFCETVGKPREEIIGKTDFDLFPPDLAKSFRFGDERAIEDGRYEDPEEEIKLPNGQRRFIHVIKTAYRGLLGEVQGTQGIFLDVTGYRQLFRTAPIGFHELDMDGVIERVNDEELRILSLSEKAIVGKHFWDLSDKRDVVKTLFERQKDGSVKEHEWNPINLLSGRGELIPVSVNARVVRDPDGEAKSLLCAIQSIGTDSESADILKQNARWYLERLKRLDIPVFTLDEQLRVSDVNAPYLNRDGKKRSDVIGKTGIEIYGEQGREYHNDSKFAFESGEVLDKIEHHPNLKGGQELVRVLKAPIKDSKDQTVGVVGVYWEFEKQDEAFRDLADALNPLLKEKEEMLRMLSHQLRSPVWQGYSRMHSIVEEMDPDNRALADGRATLRVRKLATIRGLARKARAVAWSIDMMSKLAHNDKIELSSKRSFHPRQLIKMAREAARDTQLIRRISGSRLRGTPKVPEFEVIKKMDTTSSSHTIGGDPDLIEQCVSNVVENAFKYSIPDSTIEIHYNFQHFSATLTVRNKPLPGLEIGEEEALLCKEKEWRSDAARGTDADGMGIGLWLVDRIMAAHGGSLIVEPTDKNGWNTFGFRFPLSLHRTRR